MRTQSTYAAAEGNQTDADDFATDVAGGSDRKKVPARQHTYKTRLAILKALAIGIAPSQVMGVLNISGPFGYGGRPPPKVNSIRMMRRGIEMRIAVATIAAVLRLGSVHIGRDHS